MKKQNRYEEKNTIHDLLFGIGYGLFIMFFLLCCSTTKKTPEQKAYEANQKYISLLRDTRAAFPCDTSTVYITKTDTAYVALEPDTTIKGGVKYITKDRIITNTVIKQVTVIDSAALQQERLNTQQAGYLLQNCQEGADKLAAEIRDKDKVIKEQTDKIKSLIPWKVWVLLGGALFATGGLILIVLKVKSFFL